MTHSSRVRLVFVLQTRSTERILLELDTVPSLHLGMAALSFNPVAALRAIHVAQIRPILGPTAEILCLSFSYSCRVAAHRGPSA